VGKSIRSGRKRVVRIGAGAATVLVAALFMSPVAANAQSTSSHGRWIYYPLGVTLQNAKFTTVAGTKSDGGCQFSESGRGGPTSVSLYEVEVALDPSTCTAKFETGTPATSASSAPRGSSSTGGSASGVVSSTTARTTAVADPSSYQDNQWLDPFGIQVNAQEQWLSWTTGYCNISWSAKWKWSWLSADGWSTRWTDSSAGANCSRAIVSTDSAFKNGIFCSGVTTYSYFGWNNSTKTKTPDHLRGYYDGTYEWDYQDFVNGGCSSLLHHGHKFSYSG